MSINKYIITAQTALSSQTNGGIIYLLPQILLKIIYLVPLMFIWRIVVNDGIDSGMSLNQLLSYTYLNALLTDLLIVRSYMSDWNFNSKCTALFSRPMSVYGQVISRTVGEWIPTLLLFSLPMAILAPLFGVQIVPTTLWFYPSLLLCVSLGFAFEFIFFCIIVRLRNVSWLAMVIRTAVVSFFSGTVIPFKILPLGLDRWISYQPFGSLGGAPLSLFIGTSNPIQVISTQIVWNLIIWCITIIWFRKSKERMVSFGG